MHVRGSAISVIAFAGHDYFRQRLAERLEGGGKLPPSRPPSVPPHYLENRCQTVETFCDVSGAGSASRVGVDVG